MSYSEKDGQVVLTMSREDYERLLFRLGMAAGYEAKCGGDLGQALKANLEFLNRLYQGNPTYRPYQVGEKDGR